MRTLHPMIVLLALAAAALPLGTAGAADDPALVVTSDDGGTVSISIDGGELTVVSDGPDGQAVRIVDLEQVGMLVSDSLEGVADLLRDLQLDLHVGADNRVEVSQGASTWELDVDAVVGEVARALHEGLSGLDTATWTAVHAREEACAADREEAALRAELEALKLELQRLRGELSARGDI